MSIHDTLLGLLSRGPLSAAELLEPLGISQPTLSRILRQSEAQDTVLRLGRGRATTYGRRRGVGIAGDRWPVWQIGADGEPRRLGTLSAAAPRHYGLDGPGRLSGWHEHLPYPFEDLRPAGFLGRAIPKVHPDLDLPPRINDWADPHLLRYLSLRGTANPGDLVIGDAALNRLLQSRANLSATPSSDIARFYPLAATAALHGEAQVSSAHGEQPKFTADLIGAEPRSVIVKFSPDTATPAGQRWSDLLIAEHWAHRTLEAAGVPACRSQLLDAGGRQFLEVDRFDRVGRFGRRGVSSLLAIDAQRYGELDRWSRSASRLVRDGLLSEADARTIRLCEAFARMIGNTDAHFGNLSLWDDYTGPFALSPIYDMLPMVYAPLRDGGLPDLIPLTVAADAELIDVWPQSRVLALRYWLQLSTEERLSAGFKELANRWLERLG
jgi:hypothetical protein